MASIVTGFHLVLLLMIQNAVSEDDESCITCFDDCDGCQRIFDDDLETSMTLDSEDGIYQKSHRLQINQTCVKTIDVEFRAILDSNVNCSELSFLFVNHTTGPCRRKHRCHATEIMNDSVTTQCLITCPKRTSSDEKFEVTLMYGLFRTTWYLRDLRITNGTNIY